MIKKSKILCREDKLLVILLEKELAGTLYEKELQKTNQNEFRVEKVIKRKGDKLYVK